MTRTILVRRSHNSNRLSFIVTLTKLLICCSLLYFISSTVNFYYHLNWNMRRFFPDQLGDINLLYMRLKRGGSGGSDDGPPTNTSFRIGLMPERPISWDENSHVGCSKSDGTRPIVLVAVKTTWTENGRIQRNAIRNTWANSRCRQTLRYSVIFLLGRSSNYMPDKAFKAELSAHHDMVLFNFTDHYQRNSLKVLSAINFYLHHCHQNIPYLALIDDDYFVHPHNLLHYMHNQIPRDLYGQFVGGHVWHVTFVSRSWPTKWQTSRSENDNLFNPPFPSGGFILVSRPMADRLNLLMPYLKQQRHDDVMIGQVLFHLHLRPIPMQFVYIHIPKSDEGGGGGAPLLSPYVIACHEFRDLADLRMEWRHHIRNACQPVQTLP